MIRTLLNFVAVIALVSPLGGCMQDASNAAQAQWLSTLRSCPPGTRAESTAVGMGGYKCVPV